MVVAKIKVDGVCAVAEYRKLIPAGIIGAQVLFDYADDVWKGLRKTVVFRGAVTKDVITDGEVVTIPAEVVAKPNVALRVGVYGVDAYGNLAIPSLWADLGTVRSAADPEMDITADPSLPVWAQLQAMIGNLDDLDTTAKNNLVAAVNEALTKGGGSVDEAEIQRIVDNYLAANPPEVIVDSELSETSENPVQNKVVAAAINQLSGGNTDQSGGLSATASALLITILRNGVYTSDQSANIDALAAELSVAEPEEPDEPVVPEKTLELISAAYSGGDVPVGTAVSELTGIVVTAYYYDGTSEIVTGYTLSGTIAEGNNTVTVSYGGKTATFDVIGITESGGEGDTNEGNLINLNGNTIVYDGDGGESSISGDNSLSVISGAPCIIINNLTPGTHYSFNYDIGGMYSVYGLTTAENTDDSNINTRLATNITGDDTRPKEFTLGNTERALAIYLYEGVWTNLVLTQIYDPLEGAPYELALTAESYVTTAGEIKPYAGWKRTDYIPCYGVDKIIAYNDGNGKASKYNVFYDENKNVISSFSIIVAYPIAVPENAHYFIMSGENALMDTLTVIPVAKEA